MTNALFSPDGRRLLTLDAEDEPQLWEVATGKQIAALRHGDRVFSAAFSRDGQRIVTGGDEPTVHIWDGVTGAELTRLKQGRSALRTVFSPDGRLVAAASNDSNAYVWAVDTGAELLRLKHDGSVTAIAFSVDGQLLAHRSGRSFTSGEATAEKKRAASPTLTVFNSCGSRRRPHSRRRRASVRIVDPLKGEASRMSVMTDSCEALF